MADMAQFDDAIKTGLWAWTCGDAGTMLLQAKDRDEAYRKVIACRLESCDSLEEAESWFEENDTLVEIEGTLEQEPYEGELEASEEEDEDY